MSSKKLVPNRRYTSEFKIEAARLGESVGCTEAARRLNVPETNIWKWRQLLRGGSFTMVEGKALPIKPGSHELLAENDRLRRELANVQMDLEIVMARGHLEKAAAYFARQSR